MKAFIFDFDGVIVDSESHWKEAAHKFFPTIIPQWTDADSAKLRGLGFAAAYTMLVKDYGLSLSLADYIAKRSAHAVDPEDAVQIIDGVHDLLQRLRDLHIPIAIGSSAPRSWINRTLHRFDLQAHFPITVSADDVNDRTKPEPDIYLLAAEKLTVDPKDCVVLEDSFYGVTAAKAANMYCIGYRSDCNEEQDLSKADRIVTHYDELTDSVLRSL